MACALPKKAADFEGDDRWLSVHKRFISESREKDPDVIFLGDDILGTLQDTETWHQYFAPMHCLNFSIHNDRTENILWRVENGELDNVRPKIVVLHVGTNNVDNNAEEIVDGIISIINSIRKRLKDTYIVLPGLLPRGQQPNKLRIKNQEINKLLQEKIVGMDRIQLVHVDKGLIQADGTISHHDMFDYKNLTNSACASLRIKEFLR